MKGIASMIMVGVVMLFGILLIEGHCGELGMGLSYMPSGHSEGRYDHRCVNDGVGVDVGYDWEPLSYDLYKYLGVSLRMGGLLTYMNYETAYREKTSAPESDQRRESSVTLLAVAKPTIEIGRFKPYLMLGVGPDYMESRDFDIGYLKHAYGFDVELTDKYSLGFSTRELWRQDDSWYRVHTATFTIEF